MAAVTNDNADGRSLDARWFKKLVDILVAFLKIFEYHCLL